MKLLKKNEGFTLIELMIVVVIIGILAAVAIPQFLKYQLKSKTTEATRNLGAIKTNEEAFAAKWRAYVVTVEHPASVPDANKVQWGVLPDNTAGFGLLGFEPSGQIYYRYGVAPYAITGTDLAATGCEAVAAIAGAATETIIGLGAGDVPFAQNGVPARAALNDIMWYARGDLDANGIQGCFAMGDDTGELLPIPGSTGDAIF